MSQHLTEPSPASMEVYGFVNGHAIDSAPDELKTLCGKRLAWGRVREGKLPSCPKCRERFLARVARDDE